MKFKVIAGTPADHRPGSTMVKNPGLVKVYLVQSEKMPLG
jgi:hypothetical protein